MPLTLDQTAVLELLLANQSYADLEDLLGISQDEVRARARAALTELGGADPTAGSARATTSWDRRTRSSRRRRPAPATGRGRPRARHADP